MMTRFIVAFWLVFFSGSFVQAQEFGPAPDWWVTPSPENNAQGHKWPPRKPKFWDEDGLGDWVHSSE